MFVKIYLKNYIPENPNSKIEQKIIQVIKLMLCWAKTCKVLHILNKSPKINFCTVAV